VGGASAVETHKDNRHREAVMTHPSEQKDGSPQSVKLEAKYANYFEVGYNAFEVLIDFGQLYVDGSNRQVHTRVITSPPYAKELLRLLAETIKQYEQRFGPIQMEE
jgi:hypothetical protein